ncbi:crotonase/enoyl-CoA hydratase family protein [Litoreibacter janthinus]|uniref:Enoyl-CoA hydratase/carnithine racemase n=1 Tax=Litoreibacter janthinus TaxID=670154 RepID=A0A1I6HPN3_9RHOB|nr:crotonase/enoyl-CoA hydratase family protein [Litoreibacter janthinus]SFR56406.1 Enoyl-CoA hydratase/carnithine racemase [Litoreibacter janthinus]
MSLVTTDIADGIARVTLNRPDKMNAISLDMLDEVLAAADALRDADVNCVVIAGEGRAFCAGIDITSLSSLLGQDMEEVIIRRTHGEANRFQEFSLAWRKLEVPVIAALHGVCFGAGMQLAIAADMRIAAPATKLSIMEMKWGLVPDMGGMALFPQVLREDVLRRLTYTAEIVEAEQALTWGLVTEVAQDPLARAMELARQIADQSPSAIRAAKRLVTEAQSGITANILMAESVEQAALIGKPDQMAAVMRGMSKK